jgi:hypothetical protein
MRARINEKKKTEEQQQEVQYIQRKKMGSFGCSKM